MPDLLEAADLNTYYGNIHALKGISLGVREGEITGLIGSNGAGKSTCLKTIAGILKAKSGAIRFAGADITGEPAHRRVPRGLVMVPEGRRIFSTLSVDQNLLTGAFARDDRDEVEKDLDFVYRLFPVLRERRKQMGGTLSGGEQQMLAIGRGLLSRPKLIMLDEPSLGLAPLLINAIYESLLVLQKSGLTILLIEQNVSLALDLAQTVYVLETGKIVLQGAAQELKEVSRIKNLYLGAG